MPTWSLYFIAFYQLNPVYAAFNNFISFYQLINILLNELYQLKFQLNSPQKSGGGIYCFQRTDLMKPYVLETPYRVILDDSLLLRGSFLKYYL